MTETDTSRDAVERSYLIVKRGLYYRPGSCGYIGIKELAGRYSLEEVAERFPNKDSPNQDGMSYIHEDDAPDYSEACFWDVKMQHQLDKAHARAEKAEAERDTAWNDAIEAAGNSVKSHAETARQKMREAYDLGADRKVVDGWFAIIAHMDNEADTVRALKKEADQ